MFLSLWIIIFIFNLIEMHHYVTNMWCEQYIECIISLKLGKKMVTYEKLKDHIHFPPFKNYNQLLFGMCFLYTQEFSNISKHRKGKTFSKCDYKKLPHL